MGFELSVLLSIAIMHAVAVASPGPDFAVVIKQALQHGKVIAIYTSIGVGVGILLHVTYSILGIGIAIKTTPWLFDILLYLAAAYLIYLGVMAIKSAQPIKTEDSEFNQTENMNGRKAFVIGFVTNGLNPKATLFFLALFSIAIPAETFWITKVIYGLYLAIATACWFIMISYLASHRVIRTAYQQKGYWFDRLMGVVIILMALLLVTSG